MVRQLEQGNLVELFGLQSKPELNGRRAVVTSHDPESEGRWAVRLIPNSRVSVSCQSVSFDGKFTELVSGGKAEGQEATEGETAEDSGGSSGVLSIHERNLERALEFADLQPQERAGAHHRNAKRAFESLNGPLSLHAENTGGMQKAGKLGQALKKLVDTQNSWPLETLFSLCEMVRVPTRGAENALQLGQRLAYGALAGTVVRFLADSDLNCLPASERQRGKTWVGLAKTLAKTTATEFDILHLATSNLECAKVYAAEFLTGLVTREGISAERLIQKPDERFSAQKVADLAASDPAAAPAGLHTKLTDEALQTMWDKKTLFHHIVSVAKYYGRGTVPDVYGALQSCEALFESCVDSFALLNTAVMLQEFHPERAERYFERCLAFEDKGYPEAKSSYGMFLSNYPVLDPYHVRGVVEKRERGQTMMRECASGTYGSTAAQHFTKGGKRQIKVQECSWCQGNGHVRECARCRSVKYCSERCQRAAWPTHKAKCKPKS